jgi:cytochrome c peroxidase
VLKLLSQSRFSQLILGAFSLGLIMVFESQSVNAQDGSSATLVKLKSEFKRPSEIPFPEENQYTPGKAKLGKLLFFDPRLSRTKIMSCASCHNPSLSWGDGLAKGVGFGMETLGRRSPTILNLAWSEALMWDGREDTLEEQALGPIQAEVEMNLSLDTLLARLRNINDYVTMFKNVFPEDGITPENIGKAIATFERTVVSGKAPFDKWIEGDEKAISASAKNGFVIFNGKARCSACHAGWNFTEDSFHDIGLAASDDIGRAKIIEGVVSMRHAFKTPGLRNIDHRGPICMMDLSQIWERL